MSFWAFLLCNNFYIISFLISSVKNFLTFLSDLISIVLIVLRQQLLYIITSDHLCQEVFLFFSEARSAPMLYFPAALSATLIILPQLYTVCQQLFYVFSTIIFAIHILCFSLSKLQYMDGIFHFIIDTLYLWFPKFKYALYFSFMISKNPAF